MPRRNFCPFKLVNDYMKVRGGFDYPQEQFFIFRDGSPVTPYNVRLILKECLEKSWFKFFIIWIP